jgi:hypothetical protein
VVDRLMVIFMPASCATFTIVGSSASDCSWVRLMLARLWVSEAETTRSPRRPCAARGRVLHAAHVRHQRHVDHAGTRSMPASTSCASASAGTALGETNEVTSILCSPVRESWLMSSTFVRWARSLLDLEAVAHGDVVHVDAHGVEAAGNRILRREGPLRRGTMAGRLVLAGDAPCRRWPCKSNYRLLALAFALVAFRPPRRSPSPRALRPHPRRADEEPAFIADRSRRPHLPVQGDANDPNAYAWYFHGSRTRRSRKAADTVAPTSREPVGIDHDRSSVSGVVKSSQAAGADNLPWTLYRAQPSARAACSPA